MGEVHQLILKHGREKAREMVPAKQRHLVDVAAEILADESQALGITYSGWCLTALPHKRIPDDQAWTRQGGRCTLLVEPGYLQVGPGKPKLFGVPYGARARLILVYLQTEAVRNESREISLGTSMRNWMTRMGLTVGGETARALRDQSHRIAASNIKFFWSNANYDEEASPLVGEPAAEAAGFKRANIIDEGLFFGTRRADSKQGALFEDRVVLSPGFYNELVAHGVPLLDKAIRALRDRSMSLDAYVWLAYKLHALQKPTRVSWPSLYAQFGAGFSSIKNFRPAYTEALAAATAVYPDAKVRMEEKGLILEPSAPPIPYRTSRAKPRSVSG